MSNVVDLSNGGGLAWLGLALAVVGFALGGLAEWLKRDWAKRRRVGRNPTRAR